MSHEHDPFDPKIAEQILAYIRAGGFPHIAAEAAGLLREVYWKWLKRGRTKNADASYRHFVLEVRQAIAQGRLAVELLVRDKDPKFWLKHGPGKETPGNPGWTGEVKPLPLPKGESVEITAHPQWLPLCGAILKALDSFPEARLAVAQALKAMR
jgi:hypothetical protein